MKNIEKRRRFDVAIIGGGPKGLATHLECSRVGLNSVLFEGEQNVARNFHSDRMDDKLEMTPSDLEIVHDTEHFGFRSFLEEICTEKYRAKYPKVKGGPSMLHFRHYLRWLRTKLPNILCAHAVQSLNFQDGVFRVNKDVYAENVILATGLVGYGGAEFMNDPTQLVGRSKNVAHSPSEINSSEKLSQFLEGKRRIVLIGTGISALIILHEINTSIQNCLAKVITDQPFKAAFAQPNNEKLALRSQFLMNDLDWSRINLHQNTKIMGANESEGEVHLKTDSGEVISADGVIVATGYRYNFSQIPFLKDLIKTRGIRTVESGRYPMLQENFQVAAERGRMPLYALGAGAAHFDVRETWLPSTRNTVGKILSSISRSAHGSKSSAPPPYFDQVPLSPPSQSFPHN